MFLSIISHETTNELSGSSLKAFSKRAKNEIESSQDFREWLDSKLKSEIQLIKTRRENRQLSDAALSPEIIVDDDLTQMGLLLS